MLDDIFEVFEDNRSVASFEQRRAGAKDRVKALMLELYEESEGVEHSFRKKVEEL